MENSSFLKKKERIRLQVEDVMMAENICKKDSIELLKKYYSDNSTVFNIESIILILNELNNDM